LRKDSEVALISEASAPSGTGGDSFSGLSIIHLVVPFFLLLPLIEGFKVDIRCLLVNFVSGQLNFSILLIIVLILNNPFACEE
jgi:hypothetical protein